MRYFMSSLRLQELLFILDAELWFQIIINDILSSSTDLNARRASRKKSLFTNVQRNVLITLWAILVKSIESEGPLMHSSCDSHRQCSSNFPLVAYRKSNFPLTYFNILKLILFNFIHGDRSENFNFCNFNREKLLRRQPFISLMRFF
jgi:hypothetical protein